MGDQVSQLSDVITELETQTADIKHFADVLDKIDRISREIDTTGKEVVAQAETFVEITSQMKEAANTLDGKFIKLSEESERFQTSLETLVDKKISELYKDNKNHQKDLDDSLRTRLEKLKIDISSDTQKKVESIEGVINKFIRNQDKISANINSELNVANEKIDSLSEENSKMKNIILIFIFFGVVASVGAQFYISNVNLLQP